MNSSGNEKLGIKVKAKADPEALLNDLSSSMRSYQSTVKNWTSASAASATLSNSPTHVSFETSRPARLGLGAKPQKNSAALESVSKTLELKKQLTNSAATTHKVTKSTKKEFNANRNRKLRDENDDDEDGGRASMIKKKKK